MDDAARINALLSQVNDALSGVTPYKLAVAAPGAIAPAPKNARYMPKKQFDQLVENIRQDGNLSSLPFCWRRADGMFECLSGHHRVDAAEAAGVSLIMLVYTDDQLSQSERIAKQLSHNAIVGQDNPSVLRELYSLMPEVHYKIYSGLDDAYLETLKPVELIKVNEAPLRFEELRLLFLSSEIDHMEETLKRIGTSQRPMWMARYEDFDRFFECLLTFKEKQKIVNTATALMVMVGICEQYMCEPDASQRAETRESITN